MLWGRGFGLGAFVPPHAKVIIRKRRTQLGQIICCTPQGQQGGGPCFDQGTGQCVNVWNDTSNTQHAPCGPDGKPMNCGAPPPTQPPPPPPTEPPPPTLPPPPGQQCPPGQTLNVSGQCVPVGGGGGLGECPPGTVREPDGSCSAGGEVVSCPAGWANIGPGGTCAPTYTEPGEPGPGPTPPPPPGPTPPPDYHEGPTTAPTPAPAPSPAPVPTGGGAGLPPGVAMPMPGVQLVPQAPRIPTVPIQQPQAFPAVQRRPEAPPQPQDACGPELSDLLSSWPNGPRNAAAEMCDKYGPPDDACDDFIVWGERGPWAGIIVYREEIPHDWPTPHMDYLEQFVRYPVDPAKYSELAEFDGSVVVERTAGTLGARCGNEAMNFLAVNLAHDLAAGKITVEEARARYVEAAKNYKSGQNPFYTQGIQFAVPENYRGNKDVAVF